MSASCHLQCSCLDATYVIGIDVERASRQTAASQTAQNATFTAGRHIVAKRVRLDVAVSAGNLSDDVGLLALRELAGGGWVNNGSERASSILQDCVSNRTEVAVQ